FLIEPLIQIDAPKVDLLPLSGGERLCFVAGSLEDSEYQRLTAITEPDDCGFVAGDELVEWLVPYNRGFAADCALAEKLQSFEDRLQVLSELYLKTRVERIDHFGSYACRGAYGGPVGVQPSEHAR